jgi:FMN phosphatase YigB (HAD superfamily)
MERMSAEPKSSLLVDDFEENVLAARAFGMQAVHFTDTHQAIDEVRALLNGKV